ncbi:MAG: SEC-C metal-binding domain-containing protein, partial [Patescibacteria group bacterium]
IRKHLLEYDDVLNKQRGSVYRRRQALLTVTDPAEAAKTVAEATLVHAKSIGFDADPNRANEFFIDEEALKKLFEEVAIANKENPYPADGEPEAVRELVARRSAEAAKDETTRPKLLSILDILWMTHLENLEALADGVGLRAYGQRDPLVEYRHEAHRLFKDFWANWNGWVFTNLFKSLQAGAHTHGASQVKPAIVLPKTNVAAGDHAPGRNDPCYCGSGKKYKKCHGK